MHNTYYYYSYYSYYSYYYFVTGTVHWFVSHKSLINEGSGAPSILHSSKATLIVICWNKRVLIQLIIIQAILLTGQHVTTSQLILLSSFTTKMICSLKTFVSWCVFSLFLHSGISLDFVKIRGHRNSQRRWVSDTLEHVHQPKMTRTQESEMLSFEQLHTHSFHMKAGLTPFMKLILI